jgi:hypothetical protein
MFIFRLLGTDNGTQIQLCIHVFVNSGHAIVVSFTFQIDLHASVSVHSIVQMVYLPDLGMNLCFASKIICFPMLEIVIVGVRTQSQASQEPTQTE